MRWLRNGVSPLSASSPSSSEIKAALVKKHAEFARNVAVKTARGIPGRPVEDDDAEQLGMEALIVSANRFNLEKHDPTLGTLDTNFKSFAYMRIYGSVIDEARRNTFIKRRGLEKGVEMQLVSLDAPVLHAGALHDDLHPELAAVTGDPDYLLDFEAGMGSLDDRERYVVLAFAAGVKGREIAATLDVCESRVSQINTDAKAKLLQHMEVAA